MTDHQPGSDSLAIASAYDRWSAQYDTDRNLTRDLDAAVLRRSAGLQLDGLSVLEIGCGTGKNTEWVAQHASQLVAMDFSAGMLQVAAERVRQPHVRFIEHDVRDRWPIADDSIDVVIGNLVLEHVKHLAPIYAEAARVLRDGGHLYFCELHPFRQWQGSQARFTERSSGETVHVSAFVHTVGDYLNNALQHAFVLREVGEWLEDGAPDGALHGALPRLLSLRLMRAARM